MIRFKIPRLPICNGLVLKRHRCYRSVGDSNFTSAGRSYKVNNPPMPIVDASISLSGASVAVRALLDTGAGNSILSRQKFSALEDDLSFLPPVEGARLGETKIDLVGASGRNSPKPLCDLSFVFPRGHTYSSEHGFVVMEDWNFDLADMWVGQDIFSQLVVHFNGVDGMVSVIDPKIGLRGLFRSIRKFVSRSSQAGGKNK